MPADATDSVETVGKVLTALALTTVEKSYAFTKNTSRRVVQCVCPGADWYYAYTTSGPYFPVSALCPFDIKLNFGDSQTIYFKTQASTGTLSLVVKG